MMKIFTLTLLLLSLCHCLAAQTVIDFESVSLPAEGFDNGSDFSGGFSFPALGLPAEDGFFLPNDYMDNDFGGSWTGWSLSSVQNSNTPGFMNQYAARPGAGNEGSDQYAVSFGTSSSLVVAKNPGSAELGFVEGFYVTNTAYAYFSMLDGDAFTKRFGGETGDDPDFLLLTVKGYSNGLLSTDSVDFYLADYRFVDNAQDYIVEDWTYLDLSTLPVTARTDSLQFFISGSDVGMFGLNTPAYFAMDDVDLAFVVGTEQLDITSSIKLYPNPTADFVHLNLGEVAPALIATLLDATGRPLHSSKFHDGDRIDLRSYPPGVYLLQLFTQEGTVTKRLVKR